MDNTGLITYRVTYNNNGKRNSILAKAYSMESALLEELKSLELFRKTIPNLEIESIEELAA